MVKKLCNQVYCQVRIRTLQWGSRDLKDVLAIMLIKKATQEAVVKAEDRGKNLMGFGLPEVAEESYVKKIEEN